VSDSFDPYFEWLGVRGDGSLPDHYRLLGLDSFESDPGLIGRAADAALARVRRIRPGAHLAQWSSLLDQLVAAKACLLSSESKATYDTDLRNPTPVFRDCPDFRVSENGTAPFDARSPSFPSAEPAPMASTIPAPAPEPAPVEEPMQGVARPVATVNVSATAQLPESSWTGPIIAGLVVMLVGLGGALVYTMRQRDRLSLDFTGFPASKTVDASFVETSDVSTSSSGPSPHRSNSQPAGAPVDRRPDSLPRTPPAFSPLNSDGSVPVAMEEPEKAEPTIDAQKAATFARAVAEARAAFSDRDMDSARKHMKTAADNAQTPEDGGQVDRLKTMQENLTQFWDGIRVAMAKYSPTDEIVVKNMRAIVVESGRDQLTVRAEGRTGRYRATTLPTPFVMVMIEQFLGKDPGSKAIIGTFLAVDPNGDRALAKRYWREAARAGFDTEKLLHELDGTASAGPVHGRRVDPPTDRKRLQVAERFVRETFKNNFADAATPAKKAELARELLARGAATADNPDAGFVMFREACDLAVAAGQPALACEAVEQMARYYNVDELEWKTVTLKKASRTSRGASRQREIAQNALGLVEQAVQQQQMEQAGRLAVLALAAARKSNSTSLMRHAAAADQQVKMMHRQGGKNKK